MKINLFTKAETQRFYSCVGISYMSTTKYLSKYDRHGGIMYAV